MLLKTVLNEAFKEVVNSITIVFFAVDLDIASVTDSGDMMRNAANTKPILLCSAESEFEDHLEQPSVKIISLIFKH